MSLLSVTILSGGILLGLIILFFVEAHRGVRYAERVRGMLDQSLDRSVAVWRHHTPHFRGRFWKQVFHFLTHKILTGLLVIVRKFEEVIHRAAHFNKKQARRAVEPNPSAHLTEIAAHKESSQLTEREKKVRKDRALRGD